jgi:carbon-monoxide dehydrogenase medium subunit
MKPAPFEYIRVDSVDEAVAILAEEGDEAKILAGGQSLIPMMRLRLSRPSLLIDVSRIAELRGTQAVGDRIRVGALTRHLDLERGDPGASARAALPIVADIARHIGHIPVRTRGTIGGSLAHADPSSEWCLLALALDVTLIAAGPAGSRSIPVADFFQGFMTTSLRSDEMLTGLEFDVPTATFGFEELSRSHGDFAMAAAAVAVETDPESGLCRHARVTVGGVSDTVKRIPQAEDVLLGNRLDASRIAQAADSVRTAIRPPSDVHGSTDFRRALTAEQVARALTHAKHGVKEAHRGV